MPPQKNSLEKSKGALVGRNVGDAVGLTGASVVGGIDDDVVGGNDLVGGPEGESVGALVKHLMPL